MTFNYDLTADDFVQAQHLFLRKTLGKRFGLVLIVFVFLVILGIYCLWGWLSGKNPPSHRLMGCGCGSSFYLRLDLVRHSLEERVPQDSRSALFHGAHHW
jgi:hypothetical protein